MKTKIVVRLAVSFAAVLVVFSVLLGTVFMLLFRAYSWIYLREIWKNERCP
jgi:TRAP-type C4-dicarboxylate transport system permease small subunit